MYTKDKILEIVSVAKAAGLSFPDDFAGASLDALCKTCNGVGSASMPEKLRAALTKAYVCSEATAAIHDWRYGRSDGLPESQRKADEEFLQNGLKEVRYRHEGGGLRGWLCRLWDERKIVAAYRLLEAGGESAWCVAFRDNVLKLTKNEK